MDNTAVPLHESDPLTRFSDRARDYAAHRPSYPAAAIDAILDGLGDPHQLRAADIGAGTGISSRLLADRGAFVWAVEPNQAMTDMAEPHSNVEFVDANATATSLGNNSVDLVTAFQAFHWFYIPSTLDEFHRILKPCGRLVAVWNDRDSADAFTGEYGNLIRGAAGHTKGVARADPGYYADAFAASHLLKNVRQMTLANSKKFTADGLVGMSLSASYIPREGPKHDRLMEGLKRIHAKFSAADGAVTMVYRTEMIMAERA